MGGGGLALSLLAGFRGLALLTGAVGVLLAELVLPRLTLVLGPGLACKEHGAMGRKVVCHLN